MIEVKEVTKSFGNKENALQVLKGVSLKIEEGDFAVILGASGSGKSTFLNVISGLERPDSGALRQGADTVPKKKYRFYLSTVLFTAQHERR